MNVENLSKKYDDKIVLDGITLEFPQKAVISLIGPNGAGKSTLMGIISRLLERTGGAAMFDGKDVRDWKSSELAKRLSILTQSHNVQMKLTVRELVAFGRFPYSAGHLTAEDKAIIDRAIHGAYRLARPLHR
ncbi:MAG: ATP-binding cassette domain-containing protein [Treponema sp.]|nr:ATP-binding cassette domain-containing protein [Treponema sp.]